MSTAGETCHRDGAPARGTAPCGGAEVPSVAMATGIRQRRTARQHAHRADPGLAGRAIAHGRIAGRSLRGVGARARRGRGVKSTSWQCAVRRDKGASARQRQERRDALLAEEQSVPTSSSSASRPCRRCRRDRPCRRRGRRRSRPRRGGTRRRCVARHRGKPRSPRRGRGCCCRHPYKRPRGRGRPAGRRGASAGAGERGSSVASLQRCQGRRWLSTGAPGFFGPPAHAFAGKD